MVCLAHCWRCCCCCRFAILTSRAFTKLLEAACCHWPLTSWRGALTAVLLALGNVGVLTLGATLGARYGPLALIICTIVLEAVSMAAKVRCSTSHLLTLLVLPSL